MNIFDAFATYTFPVDPTSPRGVHFVHPVKIINPKNNKSVTIKMLLDTGSTISLLSGKDIASLGLNIESGKEVIIGHISGQMSVYEHKLLFQIGNLKPITIPAMVSSKDKLDLGNILGREGLFERMRVEISGRKATYIELAALGMANSSAYFRSRF